MHETNMKNIKVSGIQGNVTKSLLVAFFFFTTTYASPLDCCPTEIGWRNHTRYCNDDSKVNLNCSDLFLAYSNSEKYFHVDNASSLIEVERNTSSLLARNGEYCQADLNDGDLSFVVCFTEYSADSDGLSALNIYYGICCVVSSIFLALTLITYLILPKLRELQDKAIMSLCISFMSAFLTLGIYRLDYLDVLKYKSTCIVIGFVTYYSFLGAFCWLNVISFNIWKSLWFPHYNARTHVLFIAYSLFAWTTPLCILLFAFVIHSLDYTDLKLNFGEGSCWFEGNTIKWMYFYGPVSALLIMNLVYLGLTCWKLWYQYGNPNSSSVKVLKVKCAMYAKLSLMMGATWIFEIISVVFKQSSLYYWIIPDTLNVLQGLFIFCLFVLSRERVKKLLAIRKPYNISFPQKWASCKDQEEWDGNDADNIEFSNTLI